MAGRFRVPPLLRPGLCKPARFLSRERGLLKAQKILIRLGAKPDIFEPFPENPPRMHWRTYERLRRVYEIARDRSIQGVLEIVPRVERDFR